MLLSAIASSSNLIPGQGFSGRPCLLVPNGWVMLRNDVIDWPNDAYAMERSLEVMLRRQAYPPITDTS